MKARLLVGASLHTPFSPGASRRESTYGETPYLWGKAHNAREHKDMLASIEQSPPAAPMANGAVIHLDGAVYHFPSWPCPPCRSTIARRAINCHPCNRSKAWSKEVRRSACRLAFDPADHPMTLPAVVSPRVAFGRVAHPACPVPEGPTVNQFGSSPAARPIAREVMQISHNFCEFCITCPPNPRPMGHRPLFKVACNMAMLPATLPARLPRWPRPQLFPNTACHVMVFNADSALPMLNQHCFSRPHCVRRRRSSCKNHIPNLKITFLTAPDRVERPVKSNALPPGSGSDPNKWVNDPFPATIQCSPHIGNVRRTLAPGFRPRPHPAYSPSQSRSPATYGSPSYFMGPAHQTPLCCRPEMPA